MTKLWSKGYELEPAVERFGAARNAALDAELARHDLWGSLAYARMLRHVGLLDEAEWHALDGGLRALLAEVEHGGLRPSRTGLSATHPLCVACAPAAGRPSVAGAPSAGRALSLRDGGRATTKNPRPVRLCRRRDEGLMIPAVPP